MYRAGKACTKEIGFEQDRKIKFGKMQIQNKFSELGSQKKIAKLDNQIFFFKISSVEISSEFDWIEFWPAII